MEIPDSIKSLTVETVGDKLNPLIKPVDLPLEDIIHAFKRSLTAKELKYFELGLLHYKNDKLTYASFIKTALTLLCENITASINESDIATEKKDILLANITKNFISATGSIEALLGVLPLFTEEKKMLDAKHAALIITGYAINCLKKIYNN